MTLRIVHLEDTKPLRDTFKATVMAVHSDCEIHQFSGSDEAVEYITAHCQEIDLYLLDVRVPGEIDGLGVAEFIHDRGCRGVLVMTSAFMTPGQDRLQALNALWFQKPWKVEDIQEMLRLAEAL